MLCFKFYLGIGSRDEAGDSDIRIVPLQVLGPGLHYHFDIVQYNDNFLDLFPIDISMNQVIHNYILCSSKTFHNVTFVICTCTYIVDYYFFREVNFTKISY